eukprot:7848829-Pyramimonas_sp.AAC.1
MATDMFASPRGALAYEDRLSINDSNGRGRPAQRLLSLASKRRCRGRSQRLWQLQGKPATAWTHAC